METNAAALGGRDAEGSFELIDAIHAAAGLLDPALHLEQLSAVLRCELQTRKPKWNLHLLL